MLENEWFSICIFSSGILFSNETVHGTPETCLGLSGEPTFSPSNIAIALSFQFHSLLLVVLELTTTQLVPSGCVLRVVGLKESSRVAVKTIFLFEKRDFNYLRQR